MPEEGRFLAGSFLAMSEKKEGPNEHKARIFLVIEATNERNALKAATGLLKTPKALIDMLMTIRPWPDETVVIDHEYLDKHMNVKVCREEGK